MKSAFTTKILTVFVLMLNSFSSTFAAVTTCDHGMNMLTHSDVSISEVVIGSHGSHSIEKKQSDSHSANQSDCHKVKNSDSHTVNHIDSYSVNHPEPEKHHHSAMEAADKMPCCDVENTDCSAGCEGNCQCPKAAFSTAVLSTSCFKGAFAATPSKILLNHTSFVRKFPAPLYRPPIAV